MLTMGHATPDAGVVEGHAVWSAGNTIRMRIEVLSNRQMKSSLIFLKSVHLQESFPDSTAITCKLIFALNF